jgi:polyisoprenyl-phosphate glycosyltransferase
MRTAVDPYVILLPVYNDWESVASLLCLLDDELSSQGFRAEVVCVDDGSTQCPPPELVAAPLESISRVEVLTLKRNLGHQRALAVGLCYLARHRSCRAVLVMDADGEDLPSDVPRLISAFESGAGDKVIFAQRRRRSEGFAFTSFYHLFRLLHRVLTGMRVEVGNFSLIPRRLLEKLVVVSDLWNHYAAAVVHSRLPHTKIATRRGKRMRGQSQMNFVSLVSHGLSAMSVYADRIGVRLLIAASTLMVLLFAGIAAAVAIRMLTTLAIPGWATLTVGILVVLFTQVLALSLIFAFMIQSARAATSFVPVRDYDVFVETLTCLWARGGREKLSIEVHTVAGG